MKEIAPSIEAALLYARLPYVRHDGRGFYLRPEVQRVAEYMRMLVDPPLSQATQTAPGPIGCATGGARADNARGPAGASVIGSTEVASPPASPARGRHRRALPDLRGMALCGMSLVGLYDRLVQEIILREFRNPDTATLKALRAIACQHNGRAMTTAPEFVARISEPVGIAGRAGIQLMTIHQAKGLEFDTVFVVGCDEGIIPHVMSLEDAGLVEEERRLCYVAMTRAADALFLSSAARRTLFGEARSLSPSRFISEALGRESA